MLKEQICGWGNGEVFGKTVFTYWCCNFGSTARQINGKYLDLNYDTWAVHKIQIEFSFDMRCPDSENKYYQHYRAGRIPSSSQKGVLRQRTRTNCDELYRNPNGSIWRGRRRTNRDWLSSGGARMKSGPNRLMQRPSSEQRWRLTVAAKLAC